MESIGEPQPPLKGEVAVPSGADGGVPLVTIADTDQQRKEVFIKKTRKKITRKEPSAIAICGSFLNRKIY